MNVIEETLDDYEEQLPEIAEDAAALAEQAFERQALSAIVSQITPEIDEYLEEGVIDTRT